MRILLLLCVLSAVNARTAFAVNFASKTDIDAIEAQLLTAQGMDDKIRKARLKYEAADSNIETSKADLRGLKRDVEREEAKQRAARTKAIHMTIQAWGLAPANLSGTSVMRWTKGRTITWLPVAGEIEDRQVESPEGELGLSKKPSEPADAVTYPDGVTYISESRFLRGPGYLASVLLHERTHFEQFTTEGTGNVLSRAQRQEQALQAEVDNTKYFYDPVKDKDLINETKNALRKEKQKVLLEKGLLGRLRRLLPADGKPDSSESIVHTNAELADIGGLVAQARAQADIARRDREKREAIAQAEAEEVARRARGERLKYAYVNLARRYCANPESVSQEELDVLRQSDRPEVSDTAPDAPTGCSGPLYFSLLNGASAEAIRRELAPKRAADLFPPRQVVPDASVPPTPFENALPELSAFAAEACRAPETVSIGDFQAQIVRDHFNYDYSYRGRDADIAAGLSSRFDECSKALFRRLIDMHRGRQYQEILSIDRQWIQNFVAAYALVPDTSSGGGRGRRCEDYGNINCPK